MTTLRPVLTVGASLAFAALLPAVSCYTPLTAGAASADLLDRDPCDGWEDKPGCSSRETAGDRWSADQRAAKHVPREEAEAILDQVAPLFPRDWINVAEVTPQGNVVIAGRADLLVIYCDDEKIAMVADLAGGFGFAAPGADDQPDPDEAAAAIGSRCAATLMSNKDRPVKGASGCRTFVCFADDALFKRLNPDHPDEE